MAGTLLLVEDEESIASLLRAYLERDGYRVVWVTSGEAGIAALEREPARLVILDIGLRGMDGFEVCRLLRRRSSVPILMLTARDEEVDRVAGLEVGADDYVIKPFSPREVVARVKAVLRRAEPQAWEDELARDGVVVRRATRQVVADGEAVELTAKEFDLLVYLFERGRAVVSRERLLADVWRLDFPAGTRTVDMHVSQLRRKLGRPDLIRTVRGAGYKLTRE